MGRKDWLNLLRLVTAWRRPWRRGLSLLFEQSEVQNFCEMVLHGLMVRQRVSYFYKDDAFIRELYVNGHEGNSPVIDR